jgi:hypothetical protein
VIGADYFSSLGLRMVRGREFTRAEEEDAAAPGVAIVDEAFARRLFPNEDPLGQMIRIVNEPGQPSATLHPQLQIVGIAPPIKEELLDVTLPTHVYVPFGRYYNAGMFVLVRRTSAVEATAESAAAETDAFGPGRQRRPGATGDARSAAARIAKRLKCLSESARHDPARCHGPVRCARNRGGGERVATPGRRSCGSPVLLAEANYAGQRRTAQAGVDL